MRKEKTLSEKKAQNIRIYKIYKILSEDLLFYYTISYLFMTTVKGLTASQIVFGDAFYPFFNIVFSIPIALFASKFGKKKTLILSTISLALYIAIVLILKTTLGLIIANIFCAIGFTAKSICDSAFIYDSIDSRKDKQTEFAKIESSANSKYYFLDAVSSFATGFLFVINPYLPMTISLIILVFTTFISLGFYEIKPNSEEIKLEKVTLKSEISDLKNGFKFIIKSRRLKALIIYCALFNSFMELMLTLRTSVLEDINLPTQFYGIVFSIFGIIAAFATTRSTHIHEKHRNRSLAFIGYLFSFSIILTGLIPLTNLSYYLIVYFTLVAMCIAYMSFGPYYTLSRQYLSSFAKSNTRIKIFSANQLVKNTIATIISLIFSYVLELYSNSQSTLISGISLLVLLTVTLIYMSSRVGLKPEEYSMQDIETLEQD